MTVGSHLECQLQTAQTHSETHGVEVDVIILGGRGATAVISVGCKVFSEWTQGVHIFEYRNIHRDFLTSSLPNIFRHVLLGPGEQVQQRGGAEAHARLLLLVVELDYDVLHLVAPH